MDIDTGQIYSFKKAIFQIFPGIKYAQRAKPGTRILFVKIPPGNDKQLLEISKDVERWLEKKSKRSGPIILTTNMLRGQIRLNRLQLLPF